MLRPVSTLPIENLIQIYTKTKQPRLKAKRSFDVAYKAYKSGDLSIAREYLSIAINICTDIFQQKQYIECLLLSGAIFIRGEKIEEAKKHLLIAHQMAYDKKLYEHLTMSCILLADSFFKRGECEYAYSYVLIAEELCREYHLNDYVARVSSRLSRYFFETGDTRKALAIELANIHLDKGSSYLNTLTSLGVFLDVLGFQGHSLQCYLEALRGFDDLSDELDSDAYLRTTLFNVLYNISLLLLKSEDLPQLDQYFHRLKDLTNKYTFTFTFHVSATLMEGNILFLKNCIDEAEKLLRSFIAQNNFEEHERIRGQFISQLAKIKIFRREFNDASFLLEKALEIFDTPGDPTAYISVLNAYSQTLIKIGLTEQANTYLKKCIEKCVSTGMSYHELEAYKTQLELARVENNKSMELEAFRNIEDIQKRMKDIGDEALFKSALVHASIIVERERNHQLTSELSKKDEELRRKTAELQALGLQVVHTNKLLSDIEKNIQFWNPKELDTKFLKSTVSNYLTESSKIEWSSYEKHFSELYPDFIRNLTKLCPELTIMEVKVCSLIKSQFSSENIASILCVSRRTIDSHRYHIRKKLALEPNTNLYTYFNQV